MNGKLSNKLIGLNDIREMIVDSLGLEENVQITGKTRFSDLGAESIDILDLWFRSGTEFVNYTHGEKIDDEGKALLSDAGKLYSVADFKHLLNLAQLTKTRDFVNQVTIGDLVRIHNWEVIKRSEIDIPVSELLTRPFQLLEVLRDMGIPLEKYIRTSATMTMPRNLVWRKLSKEGEERLINAGEYVGNVERAEMLAREGGGEKGNLASFYSHLTSRDLLNVCAYESSQRGEAA